MLRPRHRFQPLRADFIAAAGTYTIGTLLCSIQGCLDDPQKATALTGALKQRLLGERGNTQISDVLWMAGIQAARFTFQTSK
jgi:hypothetical protein